MMSDDVNTTTTSCSRHRTLREWLRVKLDDQTIAGLNWTDKEHGNFSISWKHGNRKGYDGMVDKHVMEVNINALFVRSSVVVGNFVLDNVGTLVSWSYKLLLF